MSWRVPGLTLLDRRAGGDGTEIWRARRTDGSVVAVKILTSARPDRLVRFGAEGRLLRAVGGQHGVIRCFELFDQPPAQVLEYLELGSLHDRVGAGPPGLPVSEACRIAVVVADAAAWLHRHDIIHRDIKPSNILLGPGGAVRLADLGVAAAGRPPRGMPDGYVEEDVGTLGFAAPELLRDPATATVAVDVYGLGATLYEALTGFLPYDFGPTEPVESLRGRIEAGETPVPIAARGNLAPGLAAVVDAALAPDPAVRPGSAAEFATRIGPFA